jgi:CRISPR-associated endonuclease/helicase Cas3
MSPEPLAKSTPPQTLRSHTEEVEAAVIALTNALSDPLESLVPPDFVDMLRYAAVFHDLGKVASGFQTMVTTPRNPSNSWKYRHEALSTAILLATGLADTCDPRLLAAVLTHHRPLDDAGRDDSLGPICGRGIEREDFEAGARVRWGKKIAELSVRWDWVLAFLEDAVRTGRVPPLPKALPASPYQLPDLFDAAANLDIALRAIGGISQATIPWILARGLLMAGDHLASAGLKAPLTSLSGGKIRPPEGFQARLRDAKGNAILEAPTASGKTEAALHWALANRLGGERIFYVLPYQASINKMTLRLEVLFGKENVGLLHHGAALQEFTRHFDGSDYDAARDVARERVDATRQFYRPVKVLTPFQILRIMFGCRYFEIGLAEILGGIVIFDEIHAYEPHISALIDLSVANLLALRVRFLFMTATFPEFMRTRLSRLLGRPTYVIVGPDDPRAEGILQTARHRLRLRENSLEELTQEIADSARCGERVLVVCNRVKQAQDIYKKVCKLATGKVVSLIHGRFIARDRADKERKLSLYPDDEDPVRQQIPAADILIATQVVEVSLNLSFDICFTEVAPVDALLQRFGRVNRMNQHGHPVFVHVATKFDEKRVRSIYSPERIAKTIEASPAGASDEVGVELFAAVEGRWVRDTYASGYTLEEQKKYDSAFKAFEETVANLCPYFRGSEQEFHDLFDSVDVVPLLFREQYREAIAARRFYDAVGFVASMRLSSVSALKKRARLDRENHVYFVDCRYDACLGIVVDESEADPKVKKQIRDEQFGAD